MRPFLPFLALVPLLGAVAVWQDARARDTPGPAPGKPTTTFNDIRPLLQARCVKCHGEQGPKAELDLRTAAGVRKGSESGPVVVPGRPGKSLLFERVRDGSMPPGKKDRLSEDEVAAIRGWIAGGAKGPAAAGPAVIQHDVIPILLRWCTVCHGRHRQEAGLDLRTKAGMLRGGKSGPAIVPGKPDTSLLIRNVRAGTMPPPARLVEVSIKLIEPGEVDALAKWIAAEAPEVVVEPDVATTDPDPLVTDQDRDFRAFRPPQPVAIPAVRDSHRVRNSIDTFVLWKHHFGRGIVTTVDNFGRAGSPPTP